MAQHDVFLMIDGSYLIDCQSNFLDDFNTRFVVPLLDPSFAPKIVHRLNPFFLVRGEQRVMYTQFSASIPADMLNNCIGNLSEHHFEIMNALDTLIGGY
jgi:toxin CcdB